MDHQPIQNSEVYLLSADLQVYAPQAPPLSSQIPCEARTKSSIPENVMPMTPPILAGLSSTSDKRLATAIHVLGTEATALLHLTRLYMTNPVAREGFHQAI
jgi:hypothetical protein